VEKLARAARPIFRPLFPGIPDGHPAISAMLLNIAANMMGLGNAATPFGIKAMEELEKLNPTPGSATNAQVLFLALDGPGGDPRPHAGGHVLRADRRHRRGQAVRAGVEVRHALEIASSWVL